MEQFTPVASREPRRPGPPRVLVVDDDSTLRRLCARILHRDGYHVFEAADGQEGLELALARALDLVVLDISMPVLDGFALATALRNHERTRDIPLVFLTAEKDPLVKARAFEIGAEGFVEKPYDPGALSRLVARMLAHLVPQARLSAVEG
jgi:CheY-like chemotaxis protein